MEKFVLDDLMRIKRQGDAQISPDGKMMVYVVQRFHQEKDRILSDLYAYSFAEERTWPLSSSGDNSSPRFSPCGRWLAFLSTREDERSQIYILDLVDGGEARCLKTAEQVDAFRWAADGKHLLYSASAFPFMDDAQWQPYPGAPESDAELIRESSLKKAVGGKKLTKQPENDKAKDDLANAPRVITRFSYRRDGSGYFGHNRTQNFLLTLPEHTAETLQPQTKQLSFGDWDHRLGTLSPDGKWLCVASQHEAEPEIVQRGQLWLYPVGREGEPHLLLQAPGPVMEPLWSPDGRHIAFSGHDNRFGVSTSHDLFLLDLAPALDALQKDVEIQPLEWGSVLNLTLPFDRSFGGGGASEPRYAGGQDKQWLNQELYFLMGRHGSGYLYRYADGKSEPVVGNEGRSLSAFAAHQDLLLFAAAAPDSFEELFLLQEGMERRITSWNERYYQEYSWANWEKRYFRCPDDGQELEGWLTYPIDFDPRHKYPLLHIIHGGPHGVYGPAFSFAAQYFAAQGYFVLMMNPRGSVTYGQQFACCIDGDWGNRDMADILAGLDDALSTGYIDSAQCFAYGWSYGGYMTCWLSTQTKRYKAIVTGAPVSDLYSDYGIADITMANEWEYGGQPWKDAQGLHQRSALAHVEQVETPLLMLHGEADLRCNIVQTEQFYQALKRLGKTVVMIRYPGEYHGLKKSKNLYDRYRRILSWCQYYREH